MRISADSELSKIHRDTLPGNETAVGADSSCAPLIYRPMRTLLCILAILLIVIIGHSRREAHPLFEATFRIPARVLSNEHRSGKALDKDSMAAYNTKR